MKVKAQHEIFRLSAILYADNNYDVSPQTIHKKIIESALLENGNKETTVASIILYVHDNYGILLEELEVHKALDATKNKTFEIRTYEGDKYFRLTNKRKITLDSKVSSNTIDDYIKEFENLFDVVAKEIIHKYMYLNFQINITSFQSIIKPDKTTDAPISIESQDFETQEKTIINDFLNWDNPSKNKAIFDLSSLALEYCLLTNKKNGLGLANLRNKKFYLDSNVIYRALGINGEERKKLTNIFLGKFNDVGEKLYISQATDTEFRRSIKHHIACIREYNNPKVRSELYSEVSVNESMFNFFHKWATNKANAHIDLFTVYLDSIYDDFLSEFSIELDKYYPYDIKDTEIRRRINEVASDIVNFKSSDNYSKPSSIVDAENILWVEAKREKKNKNINETSHFLISTDQALRRWDYQRTLGVPVVMLPSQWLSILLRFIERTNNDYKSFVSFLNLRSNELLIDEVQLQITLAGISEVTTSMEEQKNIAQKLVERRFENIIYGNPDEETIFERSKQFAKSETDKTIDRLKSKSDSFEKKTEGLKGELEANTETYNLHIKVNTEELEKTKTELASKEKELENTRSAISAYNTMIKRDRDLFVKKGICKWRIPAFVMTIIVIGIIMFAVIYFVCGEDCNMDIIHKALKGIDSMKSEAGKNILCLLFGSAILGLFTYSCKLINDRLISKSKAREKKDSLERDFKYNIDLNTNKIEH